MMVEMAIALVLELEQKIHMVYLTAAQQTTNDVGRKFFRILAEEEESHVKYFERKLTEWKTSGTVVDETLRSLVPPAAVITAQVAHMTKQLDLASCPDLGQDLALLERALAAEKETAAFYQRLVNELPSSDRGLFERFLKIEHGHVAIVQAELDALNRAGYWFDFPEFTLEAE